MTMVRTIRPFLRGGTGDSMTRSSWLLFIGLSLVWGLPYFFIKIALTELSPAFIAFARVALGAALLFGFIPRADWLTLRHHLWAIAAIALADIALPFYLIATGERTVSSSLTGMVLAAIPIVVTLLSIFVERRERIAASQVAGLTIGILGVMLLLASNGGRGRAPLGGVAMIGGATAAYSVGVLMIKRWFRNTPLLATTAAMLACAALMLAPAAVMAAPARLPGLASTLAVVVLGAACTAGAYVMYFSLIARAGAIRASVVTYLNPAVAALLGLTMLHESLGLTAIPGLVLVLAGSWLSTSSKQLTPSTTYTSGLPDV